MGSGKEKVEMHPPVFHEKEIHDDSNCNSMGRNTVHGLNFVAIKNYPG